MSFFGVKDSLAWPLRVIAFLFLIYVVIQANEARIQHDVAAHQEALRALDESIEPVRALILDSRDCRDGYFIVSGFLDKTQYPDDQEATFKGMQIYGIEDPPNRYPWRPTSEADMTPSSRRYGEQSIDFIIEAACDAPFSVFTSHESPLTGRLVSMQWGVFYPPID